jgi:hypothetical protein
MSASPLLARIARELLLCPPYNTNLIHELSEANREARMDFPHKADYGFFKIHLLFTI